MKRPLGFVTAAVLLAHSLLGCCWHHAHTACETHCEGVEHEHGPAHQDGAAPHEHSHDHDDGDCGEGSCVFYRGGRSQQIDPLSLALESFVAHVGSPTTTECSAARSQRAVACHPIPPLRPHLLHHVLLI